MFRNEFQACVEVAQKLGMHRETVRTVGQGGEDRCG